MKDQVLGYKSSSWSLRFSFMSVDLTICQPARTDIQFLGARSFWELLGPKLESSGSCTNCGNVMPLFSVWSSVVLGDTFYFTFYFDINTGTKYFWPGNDRYQYLDPLLKSIANFDINSLGPKFSSPGHFHSLQLLNVPQFLFSRLVRLKTAPRGNFSHA